MKEETRIGNIIIKDFWLWSQVRIEEETCQECKRNEVITIHKGEDLTKLIKTLQKLNFKGVKKRLEELKK